jgi:predicted outer membrane repeat protein
VVPGGYGQAPTIQAAIDSCADGDVILLGTGTYRGGGNRDIDSRGRAITIRTESGVPATCIIDCEGTESESHIGFRIRATAAPGVVFEGVTIRNGFCSSSDQFALDSFPDRARRPNHGRSPDRRPLSSGTSLGEGSLSPLPRFIEIGDDGERASLVDCEGDWDQPVHVTFRDCAFLGGGGLPAVFVTDGVATFERCSFRSNAGGLICLGSEVTIAGCTFEDNSESGALLYHGAFTLSGTEFRGNADRGLELSSARESEIRGCEFVENATYGLEDWGGTDIKVEQCSFRENGRRGLALFVAWHYRVIDCRFEGNRQSGLIVSESDADVEGCQFVANEFGGMGIGDSQVTVYDCDFVANSSPTSAGGLRISSTVPMTTTVRRCRFVRNVGGYGGGIGVSSIESNLEVEECDFTENSAELGGGVCYSTYGDNLRVFGCTFWRNRAENGGAIHINQFFEPEYSVDARITNCTLHGNSATEGGGIYAEGDVSLVMQRSIIAFGLEGPAVTADLAEDALPEIICTDIFGNAGGDWTGEMEVMADVNGNTHLDPLFCEAGNGDLSLSSLSPCLEANNPEGVLIGALDEGCAAPMVTPSTLALRSHPNPFNPAARITYDLPFGGHVRLSVFDTAGRLVQVLRDRDETKGVHFVDWDARGHASGVYFCRLEVGGETRSHKLVLIR